MNQQHPFCSVMDSAWTAAVYHNPLQYGIYIIYIQGLMWRRAVCSLSHPILVYTELITLADHLHTCMYLIKDTQLGQPYNIDPECSMYCEYPLPLCSVNGLSCFYIRMIMRIHQLLKMAYNNTSSAYTMEWGSVFKTFCMCRTLLWVQGVGLCLLDRIFFLGWILDPEP